MNMLDAVVLGLVEGITEYLPVSSTGHLIVAAWLLGLDSPPETKRAVDAFTIIVQGGAILAVAGLYWPRVVAMARGLVGRDAVGRRLLVNLFVAFLPAALLGPLLDDLIERHLFSPGPVVGALFVGGVVLLGIRRWQARLLGAQHADPQAGGDRPDAGTDPAGGAAARPGSAHEPPRFTTIDELTPLRALVVGLCQCIAMWPGTSRSMTSIIGGMVVGLRPREAAEFSFLLGLPTLGAACIYKLAKMLRSDGLSFVEPLGGWLNVLVGIAVATVSAAIAVKWLVGFLSRHGFALFGWYRILLAGLLAWLIWGAGMDLEGGAAAMEPAAADARGSAAPPGIPSAAWVRSPSESEVCW